MDAAIAGRGDRLRTRDPPPARAGLRPGHHNFTEEFLFEPRFEVGISAAQIQELEAQNIRQVYVALGFVDAAIKVVGSDGEFRDLE